MFLKNSTKSTIDRYKNACLDSSETSSIAETNTQVNEVSYFSIFPFPFLSLFFFFSRESFLCIHYNELWHFYNWKQKYPKYIGLNEYILREHVLSHKSYAYSIDLYYINDCEILFVIWLFFLGLSALFILTIFLLVVTYFFFILIILIWHMYYRIYKSDKADVCFLYYLCFWLNAVLSTRICKTKATNPKYAGL